MIRAQVYCHKEKNEWDRRGYIYCWYYRVIDTETGKVLASDNTGNFRLILESASMDIQAIKRCVSIGIVKL